MQESGYDYIKFSEFNSSMSNKLFCTFVKKEGINDLLSEIQSTYTIMYNKIFILHAPELDEYVVTYNVDFGNVNSFLDNSILVHRKKESNTLYTINGLNELIKQENNGYLNKNYRINWKDHTNSILLTKENGLRKVSTKLYKIIEI